MKPVLKISLFGATARWNTMRGKWICSDKTLQRLLNQTVPDFSVHTRFMTDGVQGEAKRGLMNSPLWESVTILKEVPETADKPSDDPNELDG
jgi:hypothetical protein